jgi:ribosomal protein L9
MKDRNEAIIELAKMLKELGYDIDKLEIRAFGDPKNCGFAEVELKLSWHRQ